jgi:xanthine dehydrogenase YagT iron-sulfur-binding subunit
LELTMHGLFTSAEVGAPAPDFALTCADGRSITRDELRGQPAILAFHSPSWDPARTEQLAQFNAMVSRVPGARAEVPLIADLDPFGEVAEQFGVHGEHAVVVLDAEGVIRWRHVGAITAAGMDSLATALAALTAKDECRPFAALRATNGEPLRATNENVVLSEAKDLHLTPTRREFIATVLAAAVILAATPLVAKAETVTKALTPPAPDAIPVTLSINGRDVTLRLEPRVTLLDALREYAGLTGSKKGCDHGQCGACTVHINGRRQLSCLTFAVMHQADKITTVEGLASGDTLHPMQAAFIKHDGFQCGYCTSGQLMSATALLREPCGTADADVKECMSGNICRCGAYPGIVAAIQEVRATSRG